MKLLKGCSLALLFAATIFAQSFAQTRGFNPTPFVTGTFGNVVFPAGTAALPGVSRTFPNAVFPAGTGPRLVIPGGPSSDPTRLSRNPGPGTRGFVDGRGFIDNRRGRNNFVGVVPVPVPVYVGGGYGLGSDNAFGPGFDNGYQGYAAAQPAPQQPNVIVIYPPAPQQVAVPNGGLPAATSPETAPAPEETSAAEPSHYLIALKDHTIYSAVAYWVEGDTLHYFTTPTTHNQVSLSLLDRDLTDRLNRESGITMQLPK